jgi:hypothetical protein
MRLSEAVLAAAAALAAAPASAQYSNHGISVESGISSPLAKGRSPGAAFAVAASAWLDGEVEAVARVAYGSAARTPGRAPDSSLAGTVGLRLSLARGALRPQAFADAGWARVRSDGLARDRLALGAGAALEWFPAADVSIAPRIALRAAGVEPAIEAGVALAGYF